VSKRYEKEDNHGIKKPCRKIAAVDISTAAYEEILLQLHPATPPSLNH